MSEEDDQTRFMSPSEIEGDEGKLQTGADVKPVGSGAVGALDLLGSFDADEDSTVIIRPEEDATRIVRSPKSTIPPQFIPPQSIPAQSIPAQSMPAAEPSEATAGRHRVINNRFELQTILGSGGMGTVYKARDRRKVEAEEKNPYIAVKVLNDDFKDHPLAFISLQRESRKTQTLAHPNIVNVYDFDRDQDMVYMTMEYLEGDSLDKVIARHQQTGLPQRLALSVLEDICAALKHAHSHNITHSDFKPGNVFVTTQGMNKVFDFGIARAVSKVEDYQPDATAETDPDNKTVFAAEDTEHETKFDPTNLGALTPAYASLEMLEGEVPDIRDDIYALGCVAYELFTGVHPFEKEPANKAAARGAKPRRIAGIKRRQWRVIERALAFKRAQRIASVEEFWAAFEPRSSAPWWLAGIAAVVLVASVAAAVLLTRSPEIDEEAMRNGILSDVALEVEAEIKRDNLRENLKKLLDEVSFNYAWENQVERRYKDYKALVGGSDPWLAEFLQQISELYLSRSEDLVREGEVLEAERALSKADAWIEEIKQLAHDQPELLVELNGMRALLTDALLAQREQRQAQQQELDRVEAAQVAEHKAKQRAKRQKAATDKANKRYKNALAEVKRSVNCQGGIDFTAIRNKLNGFKKVAGRRYGQQLTRIGNDMADCLKSVAMKNPATAEKMQPVALKVFPENKRIQEMLIDSCVILMPGRGGANSHRVCRDKILSGGRGPQLVVVRDQDGAALAVGKYEVSVAEMNQFCNVSGQCEPALHLANDLPATDFSLDQAQYYVSWLAHQTGFSYRIPTFEEWQHFAKADGKSEDPNRNCTLKVRGIIRGQEPVGVNVGKANGWGLVNLVGNVQEWALKAEQVYVMGGSHDEAIRRCTVKANSPHQGAADKLTGLRVVRTL